MSEDETPRWRRHLARAAFEYAGLVAVLLGLLGVFEALIWVRSGRHFVTVNVLELIAAQVPDSVIIAVGMTYVLILGGIDLSVGSVLALSSSVLGVMLSLSRVPLHALSLWTFTAAVAACLGVGMACGLANGFITVRWRLPSFIVTLGMLEMARGGAYLVSSSQTQYIGRAIEIVASTRLFGLPIPFVLALYIVVVGQFCLSRTVFGRYVVAIGTNEEAVRLSGIDPRPVKRAVFRLCGLLAAVAALLQTGRLSSADPNAGTGCELQAIAAVVIGGTSLMGGRGSVVASFFGVLIIAVLGAGLVQLGAQEPTKRLITGGVIIAAVIADYYRRRMARQGRE
ncbi:MAG TPA: ABC transporter permease [Planctomycetota bacterium]|nr:ABC transporter permease [Planctomycetota bacterium]HRR80073.1 ABC transporter permease [Planctomycetota bacterium]HRT93038.1 ABC transporter permease [Planctomycetota bacterium]